MIRPLLAALAAALVLVPAVPARADEPADALVARMQNAEPGLETYRAAVEFSVGLHTFPYLRRTLHGDAYFKRPDRMEVVFSDLPPFAQAFRSVYIGLGTAATWGRKYALSTRREVVDGAPRQTLVMIPRRPDRRLREVDVVVDDRTALPARITWRYRDGAIVMRQQLSERDGHSVVDAQDADIRLPGVHAWVRANVRDYRFNVPVDDAVFTKRAQPDETPPPSI